MDLETETAILYAEAAYLDEIIKKLRDLAVREGYSAFSEDALDLADRLSKKRSAVEDRIEDAMHEAIAVAEAIMNCDNPKYKN